MLLKDRQMMNDYGKYTVDYYSNYFNYLFSGGCDNKSMGGIENESIRN